LAFRNDAIVPQFWIYSLYILYTSTNFALLFSFSMVLYRVLTLNWNLLKTWRRFVTCKKTHIQLALKLFSPILSDQSNHLSYQALWEMYIGFTLYMYVLNCAFELLGRGKVTWCEQIASTQMHLWVPRAKENFAETNRQFPL
jgi:hypothetical protein